jgi:hypothetical protein
MSARPLHLDPIHFFRSAQAEMNPKVVLRNEAATATDLINLNMVTGNAFQSGANPTAIGLCPYRSNRNPMVVVPALTAKKGRIIIHPVNEDIDVSVIVEIAEGTAHTPGTGSNTGSSSCRNVFKATVTEIAVKHGWL